MHCIRIYEMPDCQMVSSGIGMFGEDTIDRFDEWFSTLPRGLFPKDYLTSVVNGEEFGFVWMYQYEEGMAVPEEFEIIDFPGGLYAVATDQDNGTDAEAMAAAVDEFLQTYGLDRDFSRSELGNVITPPQAAEVLGFQQMDYYFPIRIKEEA